MSFSPLKYYDHELHIKDTTESTSITNGALIVDGGIGIAKNLFIGGTLSVNGIFHNTSTTVSTSPSTGSFVINGGLAISNSTDSISTSNGGAMTVGGGVSIGKKLYTGGNILARNAIIIATNTATAAVSKLPLNAATMAKKPANSPAVVNKFGNK